MSLLKRKNNKASKFKKLSEGKTEEQKRMLESKLLKPESVPQYTGKLPENFGIDALTVSVVFPNEKIKVLAERFIKISFSKVKKQQYITDISIFVDLFIQLNEGKLIYENGKFKIPTKKKRRLIL